MRVLVSVLLLVSAGQHRARQRIIHIDQRALNFRRNRVLFLTANLPQQNIFLSISSFSLPLSCSHNSRNTSTSRHAFVYTLTYLLTEARVYTVLSRYRLDKKKTSENNERVYYTNPSMFIARMRVCCRL